MIYLLGHCERNSTSTKLSGEFFQQNGVNMNILIFTPVVFTLGGGMTKKHQNDILHGKMNINIIPK